MKNVYLKLQLSKCGLRLIVFHYSLHIPNHNCEEMAAEIGHSTILSKLFYICLNKWPQNYIAGKLYVH